MTDKNAIPKAPKTVKGEFYYAAICPLTGKRLVIEHDPSRGGRLNYPGVAVISCHHCQNIHSFPSPEIFVIQATGDE
jgi:hypothetical protein